MFNALACGSPIDWNKQAGELYWGHRTRKRFVESPKVNLSVDRMLQFLSARNGPHKLPVLSHLGSPVEHVDGWFRMHYFVLDDARRLELTDEGWCRARHGTKMEASFSILYHGRVAESRDEASGERLLQGAPGVYAHKDDTLGKAEGYCRFVDLCGDRAFFACKLELG